MMCRSLLFFFNDTATTEIYTLSLHDALPILPALRRRRRLHVVEVRLQERREPRVGEVGAGDRHGDSLTDGGLDTPLAGARVLLDHLEAAGGRVAERGTSEAYRDPRCRHGRGFDRVHGLLSRLPPMPAAHLRHTSLTRSASRPVAGCASTHWMCGKRCSRALLSGTPHSVWLVPRSHAWT